MAAYQKFDVFVANQNNGKFIPASDALKLMLTNTAPVSTNSVTADITQIANGNGYVTGGAAVTVTTNSQVSGVYTLAANSVTFTASGGTIGPFRYSVLVDTTPAGGQLIAWWDNDSAASITLQIADTFTWKPNNGNPGTIFGEA